VSILASSGISSLSSSITTRQSTTHFDDNVPRCSKRTKADKRRSAHGRNPSQKRDGREVCTRNSNTVRDFKFVVRAVPPPPPPRTLDSSVGIATCYGLDGRGSVPVRATDLSLLHNVQTCYEAHSAFYPMDTAGLFPRV
jgi:hypothetical protein